MAEARFLAAADLHLGRPIASLPASLRDEARALGPFGAFERLVDLAVKERVDAVLLAGDVVDDDGAYFEVFSALQDAAAKLDSIPMLAIAGNHDANVLPKLAEAIDGLTLLGACGTWESRIVPTAAGEIEVLGWSFPDTHCRTSPFQTPPPPRRGRRIAMLHGDVDTPASVYAPFTAAHLRDHAADAWLLGHVHAPSRERLALATPAGYLGSACGLDPSEAGPRGAWLVRCGPEGVTLEQRALAPIAWASVSVDAAHVSVERLDAEVRRLAEAAAAGFEHARTVGVRLTLSGEHEAWREINERARQIECGQPWRCRDARVFIDRIDAALTTPVSLESLAQERSAAGRMAGLILELRSGGADALVREAGAQFATLGSERTLRVPDLGERTFPLPDARATLEREARAMLGDLLAHRGGAG
jgi:DNA repair exonuclease SbcCD nuclease subunit